MNAEVLFSSLPASLHPSSPVLSHPALFSGLEVIQQLFIEGAFKQQSLRAGMNKVFGMLR